MDVKIVDLKQRHVEAFVRDMPKDAKDIQMAVYMGDAVRAACKAGWFALPVFKPEDVAEMSPADVRELFSSAMKAYSEAMGVPPS